MTGNRERREIIREQQRLDDRISSAILAENGDLFCPPKWRRIRAITDRAQLATKGKS